MTETMEPEISLSELAATIEDARILGPGEGKPSGLAYDSRRVEPGFLFIAVPGERFDGHDFIPQVVAAGAGEDFTSGEDAGGDFALRDAGLGLAIGGVVGGESESGGGENEKEEREVASHGRGRG